jgi:carbohydrate kinase (thermoresistant glucokinase family)
MDGQDEAAQIWTQLHPTLGKPVVAVVMGVSGSGKTTIAALLAAAMRWSFQEGDALHPDANVEKMRSGIPLDDADRWPWLDRIAGVIDAWRADGESGVVTCSALRRAYRDRLIGDRPDVALIYLRAPYETIARRMAARHEHFMPLQLLDSQFATLEDPGPDENPIVIDDEGTPHDAVVGAIRCLVERDRAL